MGSNHSVMEEVGEDRKVSQPVQKYGTVNTVLSYGLDLLEKFAVWMFHDSAKENYFLSGNYGPVDEFGPRGGLVVKGSLPDCLNGEFVRVGANPRFKPTAGYHWFDGDGMISGVRIKDGNATFTCRFVRTERLKQEEYYGGAKFLKAGDLYGRLGLIWLIIYNLRVKLGILVASNGAGTANTAMTFHNGRLFSLNESDKPYGIRILEDGELETLGLYDYEERLNHPFSAHPKIDAVTGELFTFGYKTDAPPYCIYRVISKYGVMGDPVPITLPGPVMMHDFAITENYAIFMDLSVCFSPKEMVKNNKFIYSFEEKKPSRFGVLPRYAKNESQIHWFELPSCMIFHTANAWEEGDDVVLYTCRMPYVDLGVAAVHDETISRDFVTELYELRFNLKTSEASQKKLGIFTTDFPRINEAYVGRKQRYVYCTTFSDHATITAHIKYDLQMEPDLNKQQLNVGGNIAGVFWLGKGRGGSEAVFVPKTKGADAEEDDGYLLCFVYEEKTMKSEMVVIDAKTMSPEPVAVVELPTRVPYGFHALFVSEEQLRGQRQYPTY